MAGCVSALRGLVFVFNTAFWILGVITLGLGIWLLFDPSASDFFALHSAHEGSYRTVAWLMVAAGAVVTLLGCCGCGGALKMSQCALVAFFVILVLVFCLEVAAAFIAYNKQETIRGHVESSILDTIRNRYAVDSKHRAALDYVQKSFECCGSKSYQDWLGASWDKKGTQVGGEGSSNLEHGIGAIGGGRGNGYGKVPSSCCNELGNANYPVKCGENFNSLPLHTYSDFIHGKGCSDALYDWVYTHLHIAIIVCVVAAIVQLVAMALSMILCCCINSDQKQYNY